jgi:hypothetical protein
MQMVVLSLYDPRLFTAANYSLLVGFAVPRAWREFLLYTRHRHSNGVLFLDKE